MKSSAGETDRIKAEGRQSLHRRKMSKNSPIVNGADGSISYAAEEDNIVRQVNLAAAFHDHISCTKSADLCKSTDGKEVKVNLPCETDHIYANCSDTKNKAQNILVATNPSNLKELSAENKRYRGMCLVQLELIKQLQEDGVKKDRQVMSLKQEIENLKTRLDRRDRRMCLLRKKFTKSDDESTDNISDVGSTASDTTTCAPLPETSNKEQTNPSQPLKLVTRYLGRRSKRVPLRALKRRYLGPPKTLPTKKINAMDLSSHASLSSASETHDELIFKNEPIKFTKISSTKGKNEAECKKSTKKLILKPRGFRHKDFLTTNLSYFLPDNQNLSFFHVNSETIIDVPSWRLKPFSSFYQMEGTENINDIVFHRRHMKFEQDERRRKRWDVQRIREQKNNQKLKLKLNRSQEKGKNNYLQRKYESFYPDPSKIQYIEVLDQLPVLAFGHLVPLFQPSEFYLPWCNLSPFSIGFSESSLMKIKKVRSSFSGVKIT